MKNPADAPDIHWQHRKTGGIYREVARGRLQTSLPIEDMTECVIYQGADGQFWVRPVKEFEDGRFTPAAAAD